MTIALIPSFIMALIQASVFLDGGRDLGGGFLRPAGAGIPGSVEPNRSFPRSDRLGFDPGISGFLRVLGSVPEDAAVD